MRARKEEDLQQLQKLVGGEFSKMKIHVTPDADYCSRVFIPKVQAYVLSDVFAALQKSVDYENFKDKVHETPAQMDKLPYYSEVWGLMYDYQTLSLARKNIKKKVLTGKL